MEISELYRIFLEHPVVTTDTRDCPEGSIFFALKGASFNGNEFAGQAIDNGCSYAVIDERREDVPADDARFIFVNDVLTALQQLANMHRKMLGTKIIGVTGTNGKTTTKELIAAVLSEKYNVLYTLGNFNNHIGVPKTLLRLKKDHDIAVIEMGANHPGEIKTLAGIVEPDCGIITNVGRAHLGGFGSFEGVIKTKGELYDFLRPNHAMVFLHNENEHLKKIADGLTLVRYGTEKADGLAVYGEVMECAPFLKFRWGKDNDAVNVVESKMIGDYNIYNMLAAATVGLTFGITEEQICHALAAYTPSNNRSQLTVTKHNRLVVDAYNANPTSMAAALENFRKMDVQNKMVILGSMGELGEVSLEEHYRIVEILKKMDLDDVWLVGDEFKTTGHPFLHFNNVEEVKERIAADQPQNKHILIKGSNSQKLFQLPDLL
ncbi:MAG: UDP-N-acetylmuramoyl-tripeptide--D-alanyl-D-alanine ligase [Bacteroidales bacterium]|nr:UDP-N-acetylmuramoyl-tripeptide--D-alanyl-D-alanine ligase [Bacteroidales bacterium]MCM1148041.1 UDP-N-acetylmuramoyl-tripeptide--D-alanyl-D-alanine ligase [Bacteroidales bacterium]MCM1206858.1 UDP-N-acetylmuramoyl-tripeptide--D-alanyl-D-alanine ligase [Bacillota bacterium]MCM1511001.1 UDP-N-acetylmuramoyl-tripeptide--D-alanyl-D-alanine ligase [Clostridium sp.]